jgi:3-methyladenine DNA glycosylase AlkD
MNQGDFEKIRTALAQEADGPSASAMAAYMKGKFVFFGIKTARRRALMKSHVPRTSDWTQLVTFVELCFAAPQRELHYIAVDTLGDNWRAWTPEVLDLLERLTLTQSWWDTVDPLSSRAGKALTLFPEQSGRPDQWIEHPDFWLQRLALLYQLRAKEQTDTERLARYVEKTMSSREFFLRKAIGWALRQYGYTDPAWVRAFVDSHRDGLSPLSIREATRALEPASSHGRRR